MTDRAAEVVDLLRDVVAELRGLNVKLDRLASVTPANGDWLGNALPALARMPQFTAARAIERASGDVALAAALAEFIERPNAAMRLGRRFAQLAEDGAVVDGRCIVVRGVDRGTNVYAVRTMRTSAEQNLIDKTVDMVTKPTRNVERPNDDG